MAITRTNLRMTDTAVITPLDRGATGDNVADDTTFIQSAIDDTSYSTVDLQGKTYRITTSLTCNHSNKTIRNGTLRLDAAAPKDYIIKVDGAVDSTSYNLTADANVGDNYVQVAEVSLTSSGIVAGDWVLVTTTTNATAFSTAYYPEDMLKVWRTTSDGKIYFQEGLLFKYRTAETAAITKLTPRENISFENVTFSSTGLGRTELGSNPITPTSTGADPVTLRISHTSHNLSNNEVVYIAHAASGSGVDDSSISGTTAFDISNVATDTYDISVSDTGGATATDAFGGDSVVAYTGGSRGLHIDKACNVRIQNCTFKDIPEYVTTLYWCNNAVIDGCSFEGMTSPFGHGYHMTLKGGRDVKITNNYFKGCGVGVRVGSTQGTAYCTVANNTFDGVNYKGITVYPTSTRSKVTNNTIRITDWVTRSTNYSSIGIQCYAPDFVCTNNRIEGATLLGIDYYASTKSASGFGGGTSTNADMANEFPSHGTFQIVDNNIYAPRTTTWNAFTPTSDFYGIRITEMGDGTAGPTCEGSRITGNYIHGYPQGINFKVNSNKSDTTGSNCGFKDIIVSTNIIVSTPKAGYAKGAYGLGVENLFYATQNMGMYRTILSDNIFDVRSADAGSVNDAPIIGLYDEDQSQNVLWSSSVFNDNILNYSYAGSEPHVRFSTSTSDNVRHPEKSTFMGNVMVGSSSQTAVQSVLVYDAGVVSMPGKPLGTTSADTGTMWGLNVFSNITNSGWAGTPSA